MQKVQNLINRKKAELELYKFLHDELSTNNHISLTELLTEIQKKQTHQLKFSKNFKCEECLKLSIKKFPSCFFISQNNNVLKTKTANITKFYYNYINYSVIGSVVSEILLSFMSLLAKLKLYHILLTEHKSMFLDSVLNKLHNESDICRSAIPCEHILIEAINEFTDVFALSSVKFAGGLVKKMYVGCIFESGNEDMGKEYNSDCLLNMIESTCLQLSALIQLSKITSENLAQANHVYLPDLFKIVRKSSPSCKELFTDWTHLKAVLSVFPDKFYISKWNYILLLKDANCQKEYWYSDKKPDFTSFDRLIYELNEIIQEQLAVVKLVKTAKAILKLEHFQFLDDLKDQVTKNIYCKSYFETESAFKNKLLMFPGIFHISRQNNVLLLETEWNQIGVRSSHNTISESVLINAIKSFEAIVYTIHTHCFLIFCFTHNCEEPSLKKFRDFVSQNIDVNNQLLLVTIPEIEARKFVKHFPSVFYYDEKHSSILVLNETNQSNTPDSAELGTTSSFENLPVNEISFKLNSLNAGITETDDLPSVDLNSNTGITETDDLPSADLNSNTGITETDDLTSADLNSNTGITETDDLPSADLNSNTGITETDDLPSADLNSNTGTTETGDITSADINFNAGITETDDIPSADINFNAGITETYDLPSADLNSNTGTTGTGDITSANINFNAGITETDDLPLADLNFNTGTTETDDIPSANINFNAGITETDDLPSTDINFNAGITETNDLPSADLNSVTPINLSKYTKVEWGELKVLTETGIMCTLTKTQGYVHLGDDIFVPVIIDIAYAFKKQVSDLFSLNKNSVNCIAIEECDGIVTENWKAVLVWIGSKPVHYLNALESRRAWEVIQLLYNQRYNQSIPFISSTTKLKSTVETPREEDSNKENEMEFSKSNESVAEELADLKNRIKFLEKLHNQSSSSRDSDK